MRIRSNLGLLSTGREAAVGSGGSRKLLCQVCPKADASLAGAQVTTGAGGTVVVVVRAVAADGW
jgi:hypothetical protein